MFFAYVLKSNEQEYYYKGHCQDLEKRILQHNSGMTNSIRPYIPFTLVYFEQFETETEAIVRETTPCTQFEKAVGKALLQTRKKRRANKMQTPDCSKPRNA